MRPFVRMRSGGPLPAPVTWAACADTIAVAGAIAAPRNCRRESLRVFVSLWFFILVSRADVHQIQQDLATLEAFEIAVEEIDHIVPVVGT